MTFNIHKITLRYTLFAIIGTLIYLCGIYAINKTLIFNTIIHYAALLIPVLCMWLAAVRLEYTEQGGTFSNLLRQLFLISATAAVGYYTWYFLMENFIDQDLIGLRQKYVLDAYQALRANTKDIAESQQYSQLIQQIEQAGLQPITISATLIQLGQRVIGGFILSYIISWLSRR